MCVKTPIITQNLNGPCPLLAIINVLILKRRIQLPSMMDVITDDQLMEYLGDCILNSVPKVCLICVSDMLYSYVKWCAIYQNIPEGVQLNYEQNFMDAMQILPKLPKGLDVNVRFTGYDILSLDGIHCCHRPTSQGCWMSVKTPIITQNLNGPCPLLAIINVLILKRRIQLPSMMDVITDDQLMEYLGDCILNSVPKNIPEGVQLNYEQNFMDAMQILPKLPKGLDVNVRFTGVSDFEYTPECIVFDLLHIPLYHGWLVDPSDRPVKAAVGNCSYNQLVDKIINNKTSIQSQLITDALIAEEFLEKSASQLTYYGLQELVNHLKEQELCVLFRNNHFIVLYKHKNQLYQLVTDQGFISENNVVWETLNNIEGDTQFVDGDFVLVPPKPALTSAPVSQQQIDQELVIIYLVALSLQEEQKRQMESCKEWETFKHDSGMEGLTDEELAKRLQEEEDKRFALQRQNEEQQQQQQQQPSPHAPQPAHIRVGGGVVHPNTPPNPHHRRGTNGSSEDSENDGSNKVYYYVKRGDLWDDIPDIL
ncbi:unnamed protein product [Oppiella nova]|uniref:Ubiquitin carboxyl-terminal hydrolase n=1 Tax=Oppiella nova TaxID=334625 RepID=A0A7R9M3N1_9ACAR|nr:unnamed protein product [Oppiella nova]CAG2170062.1 unnamed protein product [Oppiella nova]